MASDNPFFEPLEGEEGKKTSSKLFSPTATAVSSAKPDDASEAPQAEDSAHSSHHSTPPTVSEKPVWESVLAALPQAVVVLDDQQQVLFTNSAHTALIGVDAAKCEGGILDWFGKACPDPERHSKVVSSWHEHIWRNQLTRTFILQSPNKGMRHIEFKSSLTPEGHMIVLQSDVTDEMASDDVLRLANLKFRNVFGNSSGGIVMVNQEGNVQEVNDAFVGFAGVPSAELIGRPFYELLNSDDSVTLSQVESKDLRDTSEPPRKLRFVFDGQDQEKPAVVTASYITNENFEATFKIYQLKPRDNQLIAKLRELSLKAQALLDAVPDMFVLLDREGLIKDWSPPTHEWSEESSLNGNCVGKSARDAWPAFGELVDANLINVFSGGHTIREVLGDEAGSEFHVTLAPFGKDQALALIEAPRVLAPEGQEPEGQPLEVEGVMEEEPIEVPVVVAAPSPAEPIAVSTPQLWQSEFIALSKESVLVVDAKAEVQDANPAAVKLLGQSHQFLSQSNLFQLVSKAPGPGDGFDLDELQTLGTDKTWSNLLSVSESGPQQVSAQVLPVRTPDGENSQFVVVLEKAGQRSDLSVASRSGDAHSLAASQFRSQLQIITSLFSIAPQGSDPATFDAWLIRLKVLAESMTGQDRVGATYLLRDIADQVTSVSGKGLALRHIHISGSSSLTIDSENVTPFALLAGELMYIAVSCTDEGSGPSIYIDLESVDGDLLLTAKPGENRNLFTPDRMGNAKVIEILVEQIRGKISVGVGDDDATSMRLSFPCVQA